MSLQRTMERQAKRIPFIARLYMPIGQEQSSTLPLPPPVPIPEPKQEIKIEEPANEPEKAIGCYLVTPDGKEFGPASSEEKARKMAREALGVPRLPAGCKVQRVG